MSRRTMTRDQVLAWHSQWSFTDREVINRNLDRLDARSFYMPPSGGYIGCIDSSGTKVMFVHPGYIDFKPGLKPDDAPLEWVDSMPLSTFSGHASPTYGPYFNERFCDIHNLSLPASGICDLCDE